MKVAVVGAGAWGTALALTSVGQGHETALWSWQAEHARALARDRENKQFFPGFALPPALFVSNSKEEILLGADLVLFVVPLSALRETLRAVCPHLEPSATLILASKGIEQDTLLVPSAIAEEEIRNSRERTVVLSGPSFAAEVARRMPTNLVAAASTEAARNLVQSALSSEWLRIYTSSDPIGVEVGGALKNVIAIAAGAVDGLGLGHNTRAALITRGMAEIARLAVALGGSKLTVSGLSGVGDLILTATGELSRNRTLGFRLGRGEPLIEALSESQGVAEGYTTAKSAYELGVRTGIEMPITDAVYSVLYRGRSPQDALRILLSRPLHAENE
jgi:glycerol-3-phosphate dehydrogenase (NAD(P)+)